MPNYLAVLAAAIAMTIIGFLWYSPLLFGKPWMTLKGYTPTSLKAAQKKMGAKYILSFIASIISALILGWAIKATGNITVPNGMGMGLILWLGFVTTTQLTGWIFSDTKRELYFIDTGYQLVSFVVMGAILGGWR